MTLFGILIAVFLVLFVPQFFGANQFRSNRLKMRIALGVCFIIAGVLHFVAAETFASIVPPFVPYPLEIVYLSGVFEILGGVGLMTPFARRFSAVGLILLLIAVFPANVYMALANVQVGGHMDLPIYQWIRLPFQFLLIWLVYWSSLQKEN